MTEQERQIFLLQNTLSQGTGGNLSSNALNAAAAQPAYDPITAPRGYCRHKTTSVQIIHEWNLDFFLGNVLKYIERHDVKGGVDDLKKARVYLSMEIERMEKGFLEETIHHG